MMMQQSYHRPLSQRQLRPLQLRQPSPLAIMGMLALLSLLLPLLAACGASTTQLPPGPAVSATDNAFMPRELDIQPGQTVTWVNNGQTAHTVTADDGSFNSGFFQPGAVFKHTYTKPGRYPYYCSLHGAAGGYGMAGVIVVGGSPSAGTSSGFPLSQPQAPDAILQVPGRFPTIQAAVNAAKPGDLVMISPRTGADSTYHESVTVKTPDITIRGQDRNVVTLDGQYKLDDGFEVLANNVTIENMTARHYTGNGFYWTGVNGYRGSYLTAYGNGDYGIYAYQSVNGQFDHSLAAGQPDSGFYIGACHPCHALITDVISEDNALGFSGTNAGGDLVLSDSIWRDNMGGIVPNTLDSEPKPPQDGITIIDNLVENNNNTDAPAKTLEYPSIGNGIMLAGGNNNVVEDNRVSGHRYYGILVIANIDTNFWEPGGNTVMNNVVSNSGVADLALAALSAGNNCFSNNTVMRTSPPFLQFTHACGSLFARASAGDPSVAVVILDHFMQANLGRFQAHDWKTEAPPADVIQPGMPDTTIDPQGIHTLAEGTPIDMTPATAALTPGLTLAGLGLATPFLEVMVGFYLYYLPLALYGAWLSVITWDVVRRDDLRTGSRLGWLAIVYLIPVLGPLAYFLLGKSKIQSTTRFSLAIGVPVIYLAVAAVLLFFIS